ncbi:hypothetical protein N7533_002349 [Penicillium manginii]|uniref:uncharacterized protein n=1 Tax=Penicillium manginii TaxID=203109 RepID=UPI00254890C3|nr:uncharacterized protein N7533_002349 [Penicillium manginii]KAJ5763668.1 hypothetical protein N7533_002349 [Penicillium manginii]
MNSTGSPYQISNRSGDQSWSKLEKLRHNVPCAAGIANMRGDGVEQATQQTWQLPNPTYDENPDS